MKAPVAWRGGLFLTEGKTGVLSVSSLFWKRVGVYVGVCGCIRTHTDTLHRWGTRCEPRSWDETPGELEESRLTKAQYTCRLRPYRCTKYTCVCICWDVGFDDLSKLPFFLLTCLFFWEKMKMWRQTVNHSHWLSKGGQGEVGTSAISDRGCVLLGSLTMKPRDRTERFSNIGLIKQSNTHSLCWDSKTVPWEFQTKLLYYFFLRNNKNNLH